MTTEISFEPVEISTVSNAIAALERRKGSFEEWLDCARIFSANRMWDELEKSALEAFGSCNKSSNKTDTSKRGRHEVCGWIIKEFLIEIRI